MTAYCSQVTDDFTDMTKFSLFLRQNPEYTNLRSSLELK